MCVKVEKENDKLFVKSPYHPDLPSAAKSAGGKWDGDSWVFDARDEELAKKLYLSIYGQWPGTTVDLVTVHVEWTEDDYEDKAAIFFAGRQIARAYGRDSGAALGSGVVVLSHGFSSGGSAKNWQTTVYEGTKIELKDVPKSLLSKEAGRFGVTYKITDEQGVDKEKLLAEKTSLVARLTVIEELLSEAS